MNGIPVTKQPLKGYNLHEILLIPMQRQAHAGIAEAAEKPNKSEEKGILSSLASCFEFPPCSLRSPASETSGHENGFILDLGFWILASFLRRQK
jgi:hypothetical protein